MERRKILILTKSAMHKGCCVAGIDICSGGWIRLVSDANGSSLNADYTAYCNTIGECRPLDVVSVNLIAKVPVLNQQENCLISAGSMSKIETFRIPQVLQLHPAENHQYIFGNNSEYLIAKQMQQFNFHYSLILVHADNFVLYRQKVNEQEKSKANFVYNGQDYEYISVTDPEYFSAQNGINLGSVYIVVSMPHTPIGVSYQRWYKFIAKIFPA